MLVRDSLPSTVFILLTYFLLPKGDVVVVSREGVGVVVADGNRTFYSEDGAETMQLLDKRGGQIVGCASLAILK